MDFADLKLRARQQVHKTLAVPALYSDGVVSNIPVTVRWHNKLSIHGDMQNEGYASIIEGINHLVFSREELAALAPPLMLKRGGIVTIAKYNGARFELDVLEPEDGPFNIRYSVAHL